MKDGFRAVPVADGVFWVGAVDWGIRDFHGYATSRGTTYNAYLVIADKITLVDTVKAPFMEEMFSRISSVVDPGKISYIVSNHSEMDHSGCLPAAAARIGPERILASAMGVKALEGHFGPGLRVEAVSDGGSLDLGSVRLGFMETRMLHWPDSMFTYLPERRLLFSQDAFGMHLASSERFSDEIQDWLLEREAAKYYANILLPFSPLVSKLLGKVRETGLAVDILAPDHGPVWRKDPGRILGWYAGWAGHAPSAKAVVAYDTMWGSTAGMARAVAEGLGSGGAAPVVMPMGSCHRSDVATELLGAGALAVGSPTLNNGLFPTIADLLCYVQGLKPRNLVGGAFGSFGWSGESAVLVDKALEEMMIPRPAGPVKARYVPGSDAIEQCVAMGRAMAESMAVKTGLRDNS